MVPFLQANLCWLTTGCTWKGDEDSGSREGLPVGEAGLPNEARRVRCYHSKVMTSLERIGSTQIRNMIVGYGCMELTPISALDCDRNAPRVMFAACAAASQAALMGTNTVIIAVALFRVRSWPVACTQRTDRQGHGRESDSSSPNIPGNLARSTRPGPDAKIWALVKKHLLL